MRGALVEDDMPGLAGALQSFSALADARWESRGGLRLGTPALTTRGMGPSEMRTVAKLIVRVLDAPEDAGVQEKVRGEVRELCRQFPLYAKRLGQRE